MMRAAAYVEQLIFDCFLNGNKSIDIRELFVNRQVYCCSKRLGFSVTNMMRGDFGHTLLFGSIQGIGKLPAVAHQNVALCQRDRPPYFFAGKRSLMLTEIDGA